MKQAYSKGVSGWGQFGILIGLTGAGFIMAAIVSLPIWKAMTHSGIMKMATDMLKPENLNALLVIQVVSTIFAFFMPAVAYAFLCYKKGWNFLGFTGKINSAQALSVVLLALCALPLIASLTEINQMIPIPHTWKLRFDAMEKEYADQVNSIIQVKTWSQYFVTLLVIALMPAIVEEALFRGAFQNLLTRWTGSPWVAIIIASIIFSAVHLSWYGFLARMVLGIVLGLLFYYGQSIWLNILAHFINNGLAVTMVFIATRQGQKLDVTADEHFPIWAGVISLILVIGLLTWFVRNSPPADTGADDFTFDTSNPFANNYVE
jgi:membrane protease YdiL (CAAX protease family)